MMVSTEPHPHSCHAFQLQFQYIKSTCASYKERSYVSISLLLLPNVGWTKRLEKNHSSKRNPPKAKCIAHLIVFAFYQIDTKNVSLNFRSQFLCRSWLLQHWLHVLCDAKSMFDLLHLSDGSKRHSQINDTKINCPRTRAPLAKQLPLEQFLI